MYENIASRAEYMYGVCDYIKYVMKGGNISIITAKTYIYKTAKTYVYKTYIYIKHI